MYESGSGVHRDLAAAARWFQVAAPTIPAARIHLAALGRRAPASVPSVNNEDKAFAAAQRRISGRAPSVAQRAARLFAAVAKGRNSLAEYDLAYAYERGLGVDRNVEQALSRYRLASVDAASTALRTLADAAAGRLRDHYRQSLPAEP